MVRMRGTRAWRDLRPTSSNRKRKQLGLDPGQPLPPEMGVDPNDVENDEMAENEKTGDKMNDESGSRDESDEESEGGNNDEHGESGDNEEREESENNYDDEVVEGETVEQREERLGIYPGGPENKTVLYDYNHHVARAIWNGEDRGALRVMSHGSKFLEWDPFAESPEFQQMLNTTGFMDVCKLMFKSHNTVLISAFVERWHGETNTFHFPFGEMTITLDDVKQLTGLPITGKAVKGVYLIDGGTICELTAECLGLGRDEVWEEFMERKNRGISVRMEWLKRSFNGKSNLLNIEEGESSKRKKSKAKSNRGKSSENRAKLRCCVRAYLLYMFGCLLFVDKSGNKVSCAYMVLLKKFDEIKDYAWGTAILVYLYNQLGRAACAGAKGVAGYMTLLEVWIYEHFPRYSPIPYMMYTEDMPRIRRWSMQTITYVDERGALKFTREELDLMTAVQVIWDPYRNVRDVRHLHDIALYHGLLCCMDMVEAYHATNVLRQFGHRQRIPPLPLLPKSSNRRQNRYNVQHEVHANLWTNWEMHHLHPSLRGPTVRVPWECDDGYECWIMKVSHPRVQRLEEISTLHRNPPCDWEHIANEVGGMIAECMNLEEGENLNEKLEKAFAALMDKCVEN